MPDASRGKRRGYFADFEGLAHFRWKTSTDLRRKRGKAQEKPIAKRSHVLGADSAGLFSNALVDPRTAGELAKLCRVSKAADANSASPSPFGVESLRLIRLAREAVVMSL
jgi:hypothetical protein